MLLEDSRRKPLPWYLVDTEEGAELLYIRKEWGERDPALGEIVEREALNQSVDELNRLYVSLTRAREEMYVLAVRRERMKGESAYFEPGGEVVGKKSERREPREVRPAETVLVHRDTRAQPRELTPGKFGAEERRRGDILHEILARVIVLEADPKAQVERLVRDVAATVSERADVESMTTRLLSFLDAEPVKPYVLAREGRVVLTEQDVVDPEGRLFRMDRVLVDPDGVTVVDWKTGGDSESYDAQVRNYMALLRQLYPDRPVRGVLAFIDRKHVREVS